MLGIVLGVILTAAMIGYGAWVIAGKIKKIKNGQFCDCSHCSRSCGRGTCVFNGQKRNREWF